MLCFSFPEALTATWEGLNITTIALPAICAAANSRVPDLKTNATPTKLGTCSWLDFPHLIAH